MAWLISRPSPTVQPHTYSAMPQTKQGSSIQPTRQRTRNVNEETQKQEQPVLQGSHPTEALGLAGVLDEDFPLGEAYCGMDGTCESCQ